MFNTVYKRAHVIRPLIAFLNSWQSFRILENVRNKEVTIVRKLMVSYYNVI